MSDLADDLSAFVTGDIEDVAYDVEPPVLEDADQANRVLRRIANLERQRDEIQRIAKAERDRISEWEADRLAGVNNSIEWNARAVEQWIRAVHKNDPRIKTAKLPNGAVKLRAPGYKLRVLAPGALAQWLEDHGYGYMVEREPKIDALAVKQTFNVGGRADDVATLDGLPAHRVLDADGALELPGVAIYTSDEPTFSYKTG